MANPSRSRRSRSPFEFPLRDPRVNGVRCRRVLVLEIVSRFAPGNGARRCGIRRRGTGARLGPAAGDGCAGITYWLSTRQSSSAGLSGPGRGVWPRGGSRAGPPPGAVPAPGPGARDRRSARCSFGGAGAPAPGVPGLLPWGGGPGRGRRRPGAGRPEPCTGVGPSAGASWDAPRRPGQRRCRGPGPQGLPGLPGAPRREGALRRVRPRARRRGRPSHPRRGRRAGRGRWSWRPAPGVPSGCRGPVAAPRAAGVERCPGGRRDPDVLGGRRRTGGAVGEGRDRGVRAAGTDRATAGNGRASDVVTGPPGATWCAPSRLLRKAVVRRLGRHGAGARRPVIAVASERTDKPGRIVLQAN